MSICVYYNALIVCWRSEISSVKSDQGLVEMNQLCFSEASKRSQSFKNNEDFNKHEYSYLSRIERLMSLIENIFKYLSMLTFCKSLEFLPFHSDDRELIIRKVWGQKFRNRIYYLEEHRFGRSHNWVLAWFAEGWNILQSMIWASGFLKWNSWRKFL